MKVFISSVVRGMEPSRAAVDRAVRMLGHEVIRSETMAASPESSQQTCLAGVREAGVVVLLLGAAYGARMPSGLSPTHEEFREARERNPVLAFVQGGIECEPDQEAFKREVEAWSSGLFRGSFSTPDHLLDAVVRALADHALRLQQPAPDAVEMLARARARVRGSDASRNATDLFVVVAGGPRQQIIRPATLDSPDSHRSLRAEVLRLDPPVFSEEQPLPPVERDGDGLVLRGGRQTIRLDADGTVCITQPPGFEGGGGFGLLPVIVQEDIRAKIASGIGAAARLLDLADPVLRLSDVLPLVGLAGASYFHWRTLAEQEASPNSVSGGTGRRDPVVCLDPPVRRRVALLADAPNLADDLTHELKRRWNDDAY